MGSNNTLLVCVCVCLPSDPALQCRLGLLGAPVLPVDREKIQFSAIFLKTLFSVFNQKHEDEALRFWTVSELTMAPENPEAPSSPSGPGSPWDTKGQGSIKNPK